MKNLKFIFTLSVIAFVLASCSKEELVPDASQGYPAEMTIDNWEQFVDAPDEVLEKFAAKEREQAKRFQIEGNNDLDASRVILGGWLLGEVQALGSGIVPASNYLGGTLVRVTQGSTSSNNVSSSAPFYMGQNYFVTNLIPSQICFYHQNNTSGTYAQSEWMNGISTLDLVYIQRHINGTSGYVFTQLWQYVAADVNGDGNINSTDIDIIRDLILGIRSDLPAMASGAYNQPVAYFPQGDYDDVQANLSTYLPYLTWFYAVLTCQASNGDTDRFAIKRGDLNGSWSF
jgi:hypothetical protein